MAAILVMVLPSVSVAQDWKVVNPSNTGVPGEVVELVTFAPDGNLWVGARWPFWEEGGIGVFDRSTDTWSVWANWETPLPSEIIYDVEFDASGTAWIGTARGLARYDGQTWTVYDPTNTPMQLYAVRGVAIGADGHIWVNNTNYAIGGDALYEFDGVSTWTRYAVPTELPWPAPWTDLEGPLVDHNGHVWVANHVQNGLAEYDGNAWTLHGQNVDRFTNLVEDLDGNIWMRGGVGGLDAFYKFDHTSFTSFPISTTPLDIAVDEDGAVYTGDWLGNVRKTTNGGQTWTLYLTGLDHVFNIAPDPNSTDIWIGTSGAVTRFLNNGTFVRTYNTYNTGLPDYFVDKNMQLDRDGFFWVATGNGGLSRFDGQHWRNWGAHNAGAEPYPFGNNEPMGGYYLDSTGTGWMVGNGIARWDPESGQFTGFWNWQNNPGMGTALFFEVVEDANGKLFAAAEFSAIYSFNTATQLWEREPILPRIVIPTMASDSQGNVWVGGIDRLYKWDGQSWSEVGAAWPLFQQAAVAELVIDANDTFWMATAGIGLWTWDGVNLRQFDTNNSPLPTDSLHGIDVRADGVIGISFWHDGVNWSDSGIAIIDGDPADPNNWSVYMTLETPIPFYDLRRVAFDAAGNFWVSSLGAGTAILLNQTIPCPADVNADGTLDFFDVLEFLSLFTAQSPAADINADGAFDFFDVLDFLDLFAAGC